MRRKWLKRIMALCMLCAIYMLGREGAVLVDKTAENSKGVIIIDSGHGGIDPGVVGIGNLEEKEVNLKIAGYLAEYLEKKGYETVLTRKTDAGLYEENSRNKKSAGYAEALCHYKRNKADSYGEHSPEQLSGFVGVRASGILLYQFGARL